MDVFSFHVAIGFATYSVTDTAVVPITTTYNGIHGTRARITVAGAAINYRYDGGDPTTSVGHIAAIGATIEIDGDADLDRFRMITASGTATVSVTVEAC